MKTAHIVFAAVVALVVPRAANAICISLPSGAGPDEVCASVYPATNPVVVDLGDGVPLPIQYINNTGRDMTFTTYVQGNIIFPGDQFFHHVTLAPHTEVSFTDVVLQTDNSMPIGTDQITIGWSATGGNYTAGAQDLFTFNLLPPRVLQDVIQLPVRWCVIEGTAQAEGKVAGELVAGTNVMNLLRRASDEIWLPQAKILFRSAIAGGIPVICDPDPPPAGKGKLGDVEDPGDGSILSRSGGACEKAWERIAPGQAGRIVVSTGAFHDAALAYGISPGPGSQIRSTKLCSHPRGILPVEAQLMERTVVVDQALYGGPTYSSIDPAVILAHEIGHQLFLGHGNGLDDNHDGTAPPANGRRLFDEYCDALCTPLISCENVPQEDLLTPVTTCEDSTSVMNYVGSTCGKLRPLQVEAARAVASVAPGAVLNGTVNPGDGRASDYNLDPCASVSARIIEDAGMSETAGDATTRFYHVLAGTPAQNARNEYLTFADLDGNPGTGCAAALLGFPTTFEGAELVTRVLVEETPLGPSLSPSLWRCVGTSFEQINDARVQAFLDEQTVRGSIRPARRLVLLEVPEDLRGTAGADVRVQTLARLLNAPNQLERYPATDAGALVYRLAPALPACTLSKVVAHPGEVIQASAAGLLPSAAVEAYLGDERVGQGTTDGSGNAQIDLMVPGTSPEGVRPVSLLVSGTAVNASCAVLIDGAPVTPATTLTLSPQPNWSGWNNTTVAVALDAEDVPGGPGIRDISYSAAGAQPIPPVVAPGPSADFAIHTEGTTTIDYFATDNASVTEHPKAVTVKVDTTLPSISGSRLPPPGPNGWNTGNVVVSFTCSDALSGLVLCPDPTTVATEGPNQSVTGTALDFASNTRDFTVSGINIDKSPPLVRILQPVVDQLGLPPVTIPISVAFSATEPAGGSGVVLETMKLQGCPIYDGRTAGDRDGLLSDERIQLTKYNLCQFMAGCGFTVLYDPKIRVEATDRAGNVGWAERIIRKRMLKTEVCAR